MLCLSDESTKNEATVTESSAPPEVATSAPVPEPPFVAADPASAPEPQFPVPYFGADGIYVLYIL